MQQITELGQESKQRITLVTEDGREISFFFEFKDTQIGWFIDVEFGDFTARGLRLCGSPNMLRQFRNIIDVGLAVTIADGAEPFFIDDFVTSRVFVYLLNSDEVQDVEDEFYNVEI